MPDSVTEIQAKIRDVIESLFNGKEDEAILTLNDVYEMSRTLLSRLGLGTPDVMDYTVTTVGFWRRQGIVSPPTGQRILATYDINHVYEAAIARLTGAFALESMAALSTRLKAQPREDRRLQLALAVAGAKVILDARHAATSRTQTVNVEISAVNGATTAALLGSAAGQAITRSVLAATGKGREGPVAIDIEQGVSLRIRQDHPVLAGGNSSARLEAIRALVRSIDDALFRYKDPKDPRPLPKSP